MTVRVRRLSLVLWILWIFSFSLQPASISSEASGFVADLFARLSLPLPESFLRKAAHFFNFFVLGLLLAEERRPWYKVMGAVFLVAVSDETLQRFVPGRASQVTDVLLDSAGGATAYLSLLLKKKAFSSKK